MLRIAVLGLLGLFIAGCTTLQITSDYDDKTDFSQLKTYAWLHGIDTPSENIRINNKLVIEIVRSSVEQTLDSKGFVQVEKDQADFLIAWFGAIEQKIKAQNINNFYSSYGYGTLHQSPYWNNQSPTVNVTEYEEGSLIFDLLDPDGHTLLWRGIGRDKVVADRPEDTKRQNLSKAVNLIISKFPPN